MSVVSCGQCGRTVNVPDDGTDPARCPGCGQTLAAAPVLTVSSAPPASSDADSLASDASGEITVHTDPEVYHFLAPAQQLGEIGRLGPYRVLKVLGAGGMGVVFQAEDPQLERLVALKAMKPALASSNSAKARFVREAKATATLKHDHIVTIYQVGEDRGVPFLAMEFLEGEALDTRLRRESRLSIAEVVRIGREIADGLAAAHERGLIHRDIKPGNVWLEGRRARVKILDFGLARAVASDAVLTQSGVMVGTPAYMAPEQAKGQPVDPRCDLFSLGCLLYRTCTGELPFKGTDTISTLLSLATIDPAPPRELNPAVPAELSHLIQRLLAKEREGRPDSALVVMTALDAIRSEREVLLDVQPITEPMPRVAESATTTLGRRAIDTGIARPQRAPSTAPVLGANTHAPSDPAPHHGWVTGMGIASLTLGGGALLLAWIPCISLLTLPFSATGLILGVVSLVMSLTRDRQALAFPIAGTALNVVDLLLAFLLTFGAFGGRGH